MPISGDHGPLARPVSAQGIASLLRSRRPRQSRHPNSCRLNRAHHSSSSSRPGRASWSVAPRARQVRMQHRTHGSERDASGAGHPSALDVLNLGAHQASAAHLVPKPNDERVEDALALSFSRRLISPGRCGAALAARRGVGRLYLTD
jgi:hypothetical protein